MESVPVSPVGWVGSHFYIRWCLFTGLAWDLGTMLTVVIQKDLVHWAEMKEQLGDRDVKTPISGQRDDDSYHLNTDFKKFPKPSHQVHVSLCFWLLILRAFNSCFTGKLLKIKGYQMAEALNMEQMTERKPWYGRWVAMFWNETRTHIPLIVSPGHPPSIIQPSTGR